MIKSFFIRAVSNNPLMFCLLSMLGSLCCVITRNENFFDVANYHYYNPFALLSGRFGYDIVPASINGFFNPLPDIPFYFLVQRFNDYPAVFYAVQGLWFGFLLFAFFKIATLFFNVKTIEGIACALLSTALAATGQITWFQAGSSTNEIQAAVFVLAALYILLKMVKQPQGQKTLWFGISGLIMGLMLGMKPTVITACIAAGGALICCRGRLKRPVLYVVVFAAAGLVGYLITNGWWMYKLYEMYQNPFFPFLNGVFESPYFDDFNYSDRRFIPPLSLAPICPYIALFSQYCNAEGNLLDPRFPIYYTFALGIMVWLLVKPRRLKMLYYAEQPWFMLAVFLLGYYLLWMALFSIQHYFVVLEMLGALLMVKVLSLYRPQTFIKTILYWTPVAILCGVLLTNPYNNVPFGSRKEKQKIIEVEDIRLPSDTLLKLYNLPLAGLIPSLAQNNNFRAVGYEQHFDGIPMKGSDLAERGEFRRLRNKIEQKHNGAEVVLFRLPTDSKTALKVIGALQKEIKGKKCRILKNSFAPILLQPIYICLPAGEITNKKI